MGAGDEGNIFFCIYFFEFFFEILYEIYFITEKIYIIGVIYIFIFEDFIKNFFSEFFSREVEAHFIFFN